MAGIKDVAARAGVSVATASRALSGKGPVSPNARERVLRAADELRFVPSVIASALASGRSRNVGVVVPAVDRWFFAKVVAGIAEELRSMGYDLALYNTSGDRRHQETVLREFLMRQRLDAVIPVALQLTSAELTRLLSIRRPVVGIGGPMPDVPTVSIDQVAVGRVATAHLIGLGHRRIAHVTGGTDPDRDFGLTDTRLHGFQEEMGRAGLAVRPGWVLRSDFTMSDAYAKVKLLLAGAERPTAIFAASDEMAAGAVLAARDLGIRVPDNLSVVGVDGHEIGEPFGLTTIRQFPDRQGSRAARRLLQQLASNGAGERGGPMHQLVATEFVVRTSTAVPPAD